MSRAYENAVPVEDSQEHEKIELPSPDDPSSTSGTGWNHEQPPLLWLFNKEGRGKLVEYAIDAVESGDPVYLNKTDLGDEADVSRHSCHRHIDDLVRLNIYSERDKEGSVTRYRPNKDSRVLRALSVAETEIYKYAAEPV